MGVVSDLTQVGVVGCDREVCSGCDVRSNTGGWGVMSDQTGGYQTGGYGVGVVSM